MKKYIPTEANNLPVLSRSEVREFDRWAIETLGVPGVVLMENAGRSCAELIIDKLARPGRMKVCIFCGTGNNGGDGYVIARHLVNAGFAPTVVICGDRNRVKGDALINLEIIEAMAVPVDLIDTHGPDIAPQVKTCAAGCDMVADALFGTGLQGDLRGGYAELIEAVNALKLPVVAVDIPSGLDCDTGKPLGAAVKAVATVTFAAVKKGFAICPDAAEYTGDIFVASIGVEPVNRT